MRDMVALAMVDLAVVVGATWMVLRLNAEPRRSSAVSKLAAVAAAVLLLCSLPFAWASVSRDLASAGLTTAMASSPVALAAVLLAVVTLVSALAREWTPRRARASSIVSVILGGVWVMVSLSSVVLAAGVNRDVDGPGSITAGPALWLCLTGGFFAVISGAAQADWSRRSKVAKPALTPTSDIVDEWGVARAPVDHETRDEW